MENRHPPEHTKSIHIRTVPKSLWKEVRRAAFKRDQSIQQLVIEALEVAVAKR